MTMTTAPKAISSEYAAMRSNRCRKTASFSAIVKPPKAPANVPMTVIQICTVDRNSLGFSDNSRAILARLLPSPARC